MHLGELLHRGRLHGGLEAPEPDRAAPWPSGGTAPPGRSRTGHPAPDRCPYAVLDDVSCPSSAFCLAVGSFLKNSAQRGQEQPLAEEWNGKSWTQLTAPNPHAENGSEFSSVGLRLRPARARSPATTTTPTSPSPCSPTACNGTSWTAAQKQVNPDWPGGQLRQLGVVHRHQRLHVGGVLDQHRGCWDSPSAGTAPRGSGRRCPHAAQGRSTPSLAGASCTAAAACTAVGDSSTSLNDNPSCPDGHDVERDVVAAGSHARIPRGPARLRSVSCTPATTCVAVGWPEVHRPTLVEVSPAGWRPGRGRDRRPVIAEDEHQQEISERLLFLECS